MGTYDSGVMRDCHWDGNSCNKFGKNDELCMRLQKRQKEIRISTKFVMILREKCNLTFCF